MSLNNLKYCQPEFYKFSEDSILLANEGSKIIEDSFPKGLSIKGLDLCSGCGVVGIEILRQLENYSCFHFIELQEEFKYYFQKNTELFLNEAKRKKVELYSANLDSIGSYSDIKYNLIVSNPPYFKKGKNRLGPDKRKNLCRFLLDLKFCDYLNFIYNSLDKKGIALFLGRGSEIESDIKIFLENNSKSFEVKKYKSIGLTSLFIARFLDK